MLKDNQEYKEERFKEVQMKHEEKREKKLIQELKKRGFKVEPQIA